MKILSVDEYAALKTVNLNRQSVLKQIWENRLPSGVTAQKVGRNYIIKIRESKKNKK